MCSVLGKKMCLNQKKKNVLFVEMPFAVITTLLASLSLYMGAVKAAAILQTLMLRNVLHSPNSFFDVTPLGRVLNRFSKDVDVLDNVLPMVLRGWCTCFFSV